MTNSLFRTLLLGCILSLALLPTDEVSANDGGITFGGSPKLLKSHPSVSMQSEVVKIVIGEETATVDCRFVFRNRGPKTTVRMGFPDESRGADEVDDYEVDAQGRPLWKNRPARSAFHSFKSWVDGKPVTTQLIRADEANKFWHAKTVRFPAKSTRTVRDVYTVNLGGQITASGQYIQQTSYVLHTGSSWKGNIGRSEVIVTFRRKSPASPLQPRSVDQIAKRDPYRLDWSKISSNTVYYGGLKSPVRRGNSLHFIRKNWRPTLKDDLWLYFKPSL